MGGSTESSTQAVAPPPTATQTELEQTNLGIAKEQLSAIQDQNSMLKLVVGDGSEAAEMRQLQLQEMRDAAAEQTRFKPLQDDLTQQTLENQLEMAKSGYGVTSKQKDLIDQAAAASLKTGTEAIKYGENDQMRQVRDYTAPGLGLRPSDSPVVDRQGLIAKAAEESIGQLTGGIENSKMSAYLGYPLQVAGVNSSTSQGPIDLPTSAINNRLGLSQAGGGAAGFSLGAGQSYLNSLAGSAQNSLSSLLNYQKGLIGQKGSTQQNPGAMDYIKTAVSLIGAAAAA